MYKLPGRSLAEIPGIETERLRLRASRVEDFDGLFAMWQDPAYYRFIGNRKRSSGEIWQSVQRNVGAWALLGYGYLTIEDRETGAFVGECGFMLSRRGEFSPPLPLMPEAGWGIAPAYWGKGIVKEAMRAMFDWAEAQDPDFPCHCIIDTDHAASTKIAENLGFSLHGTVPYGEDGEINVFVRKMTLQVD
ncbi:MAG: GNAT family N-acetyltransferase [Ponticaulis sp.]|nr:GNAT family N-acetyltransferase [Ponticaulis sp.]|tara:strand:- start:11949 stop:12518 length:570 start_codon:yes stop_codon:yes gene_type:complete